MIHKRTVLKVAYSAGGEPAIVMPGGIKLRRVAGGMGWTKGLAPGAFVVLGEQLNANPASGRRMLHVLEFAEEVDVDSLLAVAAEAAEWAGEGAAVSLVRDWVGDPDHALARRLVKFNRLRERNRLPRMQLKRAPLLGQASSVADYAPYLDARTVGADLMRFNCPQLVERIEAAGRDLERPIREFPAVAALFWVMAWLDEHEPRQKKGASRAYEAADPRGGY